MRTILLKNELEFEEIDIDIDNKSEVNNALCCEWQTMVYFPGFSVMVDDEGRLKPNHNYRIVVRKRDITVATCQLAGNILFCGKPTQDGFIRSLSREITMDMVKDMTYYLGYI